jgi:hypothetical protein
MTRIVGYVVDRAEDDILLIGGISPDAQTMIDADYMMKKIMAGIESVPSPGFLNFKQILARDWPGETYNRFWLCPLQPQAGDIQISSDGNAVLFTTGAQVLSEEMQQMSESLVGKGRTMASAEEAAMNFTRHYADIERRQVVFHKLQGLFDIVLLARIWQNMRLDSPLPDRLARPDRFLSK